MVKTHPCFHSRSSQEHSCHHLLHCISRKPPHPPLRHPSHLAVALLCAQSLQRQRFQEKQQWRRPGLIFQGISHPCHPLSVVAETSRDMAGACATLDPCLLSPGPIQHGERSSCFEKSLAMLGSTDLTEERGESCADESLAMVGSSSRGAKATERCSECVEAETETDFQRSRRMEVSAECCVRRLVVQGDDGICARHRLQQHQLQIAGNVSIPEAWGREQHLKDWVAADLVEDALRPPGLMLARNALINDSQARSKHLRIPASPPKLLNVSIDVEAS